MSEFTLEIVECPECAATAEIVDRFVLESTDGPLEHATVRCVLKHRFTVLVERLARPPSSRRCTVDDATPPSDRTKGADALRPRRNPRRRL